MTALFNGNVSTSASNYSMEDEDEDISNIPLADADPQAVLPEEGENSNSGRMGMTPGSHSQHNRSFDSFPSTFTNDSLSSSVGGLDPDLSQDEQEEKASRIAQVLELQNTLDDLSQRVESVKEENLKLRSENQVLGQYIESLMSASSVFQPTSPKTKRK
ncbi:short coiled-coil protein homolog [Folsomia candida]|uniref:short coiled-coil protein homolog n=1 Tax=Folsomia candida TaxID=158441 RepID=UPI000B8F4E21|nr:short coiled-coil protein homolog [Folsomia candida]